MWDIPSDLGPFLEGIGTVLLALAAGIGGGFALWRYWQQRQRDAEQREQQQKRDAEQQRQERELRQRQTDLDLAKLQGDVVGVLKQQYERAKEEPEKKVILEELENAESVHKGILRGIILKRPELAQAAREVVTEYVTKIGIPTLEEMRKQAGG